MRKQSSEFQQSPRLEELLGEWKQLITNWFDEKSTEHHNGLVTIDGDYAYNPNIIDINYFNRVSNSINSGSTPLDVVIEFSTI